LLWWFLQFLRAANPFLLGRRKPTSLQVKEYQLSIPFFFQVHERNMLLQTMNNGGQQKKMKSQHVLTTVISLITAYSEVIPEERKPLLTPEKKRMFLKT
jgi:hypothetical protein